MRKIVIPLLILIASLTGVEAQTVGIPSVNRVAGVWTAFDETGTAFCTGSPTDCIQEAINYTVPNGLPLHIYGLGDRYPFNLSNQTITIPATGQMTPIYCYGCRLRFNNQGTGLNGLVFDTQWQAGGFHNIGGSIAYCGTGAAVKIAPTTTVNGVVWSLHTEYDFGFLTNIAGCTSMPSSSIEISLNSTCGTNQENSSAFVNNKMSAFVQSNGAYMNFRYDSPTCQYSAGGENFFFIWDNTAAYNSEYYLGYYGGNANDPNLGTNWFFGNIAHTSSLVGSYGIISDSNLDVWQLSALNVYNSGPTYDVYWGPKACKNVIGTMQTIPGSVGVQVNNCPGAINSIGPP